MGLRIEQVDTRVVPEAILRAMYGVYVELEAELLPDDPPRPFEVMAADWRVIPSSQAVPRWLVWEDDEIVAVAVALVNLVENLDNGYARIHVRPQHRGRGLARRLASPVLDWLEEQKRWRLATSMKDGAPWEALAERAGLKRVYTDQTSRLYLADVDWEMMDAWIERAAERAGDYALFYWEPPIPEELIQKYCDLVYIMNTAPREDFEEEDETLTPEVWREIEERERLSQADLHCYVTVHKPTGDWVGYTTVETQRLHPIQAFQWDTAVHPDHRNRGLGRWLKATMIKRLRTEHPELEWIDTGNAASNEPMLNINLAMGFKPILRICNWQGELATVRDRLGV
ncbi:MAG: GNAT family N-acetyltransferase [Acidimicrobiia bacterium]